MCTASIRIGADDQPYARKQLLQFVDRKTQGTRFAVFVLSDGLHLVQGFTADRDRLHATLDPSHSVAHVPRIFLLGANYGRGDGVTTLSAFQLVALYLEGLPGRKNIIWASGKFPLDLFAHNDDRNARADATETLDALTRSESAIYPVDVAGVQPFPEGRLTGATTGAGPASGPPGMIASDTHTIAAQSQIAGSVAVRHGRPNANRRFASRLYAAWGAHCTPDIFPRPHPGSKPASTCYAGSDDQSRGPTNLLPGTAKETSQ
jgi:VWFA-related protein